MPPVLPRFILSLPTYFQSRTQPGLFTSLEKPYAVIHYLHCHESVNDLLICFLYTSNVYSIATQYNTFLPTSVK